VLVDDILDGPQAGIFHVGLDDDAALAVVPLLEGFDAAVHFRRFHHPPMPDLQVGVHAADVFPHDDDDPGDGRAHRHFLPVDAGDVGGAHRAGECREVHDDAAVGSQFGGAVHRREDGLVRVGIHPHGPHTGALDVEMGEVGRIIFFSPGGHLAERLGVDDLPAL
jgi:hypothetical protein